jgi:hypothetical protein
VDKAWAAFDRQVKAQGGEGSELGSVARKTHDTWMALAADVGAKRGDAATLVQRHTALIGEMMVTLDQVLEHWGLVFDPVPQDYMLIIGAMQEAPREVEILGRVNAIGM